MKQLTTPLLDTLSEQARLSPRLRAHHNLHREMSEPVHRLAIAMEPGTLIVPHRHLHTWEMLLPLRGRFVVLLFDEAGVVTERIELGAGCSVVEFPLGTWHAILSRDEGGALFEVKLGPYTPLGEDDIASWSKGLDGADLNAWYAVARVGDRYSAPG
ncbi:MAG: WbuC family cupin fold metalloprotein [Nitrosomonadales bacterium]|nr:WbuC family cupin fold metalloprotein [Nitrosomonadales bacterium]